jgi:hypothetical protein
MENLIIYNNIMNIIDTFSSTMVKNPFLSKVAYNAALTATQPAAPGVLKLFCIVYNTLLNDTSKEAIRTFIKTNPELQKNYTKYEILTSLCVNETTDPLEFINANKNVVDPILIQMGIDVNITNIDNLKNELNNNIVKIIDSIKNNTGNNEKIISILDKLKVSGGTRKRKINKKKKTNKRKHTSRR